MSHLRDLSIIATPPVERHPVKTFVSPWNDGLIQEVGFSRPLVYARFSQPSLPAPPTHCEPARQRIRTPAPRLPRTRTCLQPGPRPPLPALHQLRPRERVHQGLAALTNLRVLERWGLVCTWTDRAIPPSARWDEELEAAIGRADAAVFLVCEHFLASDFCTDVEPPAFLERRRAEGALVRVVDLFDRPAPWGAILGPQGARAAH